MKGALHTTIKIARAGAIVFVGLATWAAPAGAQPSSTPFGIVPGSFHVTTSTGQAAAHADLTVSFDFAHDEKTGRTDNDVRTVVVNLPPGLIGNNTAVSTCTLAQLIGTREAGSSEDPRCPPASQVGTLSLECFGCASGKSTVEHVLVPLYNMEVTSFGITAELGFNIGGNIIQTMPVTVRPGDSGITVTTPNIEKVTEPRNISVTTWGLPASPVHDAQRRLECYSGFPEECARGREPANIPVEPYLSNPTSCEPHVASIEADSWEESGKPPVTAQSELTPTVECERVPFDPSFDVEATTRSAESSSGLDVSLRVAQTWKNESGIATAHLKDSVVTLPLGYTANPSLASGLGVCTPQQFEAETSSSPPGAGCPPESKIGSVEVETPVLAEGLSGAVYIAKPFDNPFGSLLAMYVVVKNPQRGIIVKLAGHIEPNPVTGQLVTRFDNNPQVPFSRFTLKLRQGANSPLVSPPLCGAYLAEVEFTPWSAPLSAQRLFSAHPAAIETGVGGGPCPAGGTPPFGPTVISGTENNAAGSYSPFYLRISRQDGEQEITKFSTVMPPGLSGNLTGIPFCTEADIQAARQESGAEEEANPSCPVSSEIGHSITEAGVGTVLAQTPGKLYLAGPYHGAPLSLVSITSAKVGPFDLGTVVIRFALFINPITAQVEVSGAGSDPIPHIIDGIVVHVRNIRAYVDRPKFMINPTSCETMAIQEAITGAGDNPADPADQDTVPVGSRFQAADCASLAFKPVFKVTTAGKTSRTKGASLSVKLTVAGALGTQSNIRSVKVDLPKQLPSRLTTLQKACPDSTFNANPAACPLASIVGHAKAITPILPVPLEGPAYFVSHGGAKFPELIVVLQGYGFTIDLHGETFINKAGITSSTFHTIPDQPVTSFELTLPQGPDSALAANGNLCTSKLRMPTAFTAQNGSVIKQSTPVTAAGCGRHKAHKASHRHGGRRVGKGKRG
jgi:hypothetical protein